MFFGCTVWLTGSWVLDQWLNPQSPNYWTTHPENFWIFGFRVFINFGKISDIIYSSIWFYFLSLSNCIYARLFDNVQKTIEVPFEYFSVLRHFMAYCCVLQSISRLSIFMLLCLLDVFLYVWPWKAVKWKLDYPSHSSCFNVSISSHRPKGTSQP